MNVMRKNVERDMNENESGRSCHHGWSPWAIYRSEHRGCCWRLVIMFIKYIDVMDVFRKTVEHDMHENEPERICHHGWSPWAIYEP